MRNNVFMPRKLLAVLISVALAAPHAWSQGSAEVDPDAAEMAGALDAVIVTGTRRKDRTVKESLAPIDMLQADEIQNAGTSEIQAVLTRIVPSFNFPRTSITDASDHVRPAQLRGLAPDQTLVLINGKRRHRTAIINVNGTIGRGSSPVDLNAIPSSAIQRIEVLRDGASAQYGSDAIAGVINVVLKEADNGGQVDSRYGEYDEGDGELNQVSGNVGLKLNEQGGALSLSAEFRDKGFTNRAERDPRQQYARVPLVNGALDPRELTINRINHRFGDAESTDKALFANLLLPYGDGGNEMYGFASYADRDGESAGFFRRSVDARNIPAIYPDGFLPLINSEVVDYSLAGGIRGTSETGWSWDASINHGYSEFRFDITNSLNVSIGALSPTEFYAGELNASQTLFNFDIRNDLDVSWLNSSLASAFGAEYRTEAFEISPGEPASYFGTGAQVFPGFRPSDAVDEDRRSFSLFADFETDLTEQLTVGTAVRYEDYNDFGSTVSGKLAGRFAFTEQFAVRGAVSSGFRAPNLQQQLYSTTATNFINGVPFDIRTFPVTSPVAIALGAEPLDAEESLNISLGFVAEPFDGFYFTLDAYRIEIDKRIVLSENLTGAAVTSFLAGRGFAGVTGGRYFTNAVDTSTTGFDLIARHTLDLGEYGSLSNTFGYNHNETDIDSVAANPARLSEVSLNLQRVGRVEIGRITVGAPEDKIILGSDYSFGDFRVNLNVTRYGKYELLATSFPGIALPSNPLAAAELRLPNDEAFAAEWVTDLAVSYQWNAFNFTLGAENLNNNFPQRLKGAFPAEGAGAAGNSFFGILPYSRGEAPFGFNGRFFYGKVTWKF